MNLYWKHIKLVNIQRHAKFECDLSPQINIITGESASGKSSIMRALRFMFFGKPSLEAMRRTDSKKSEITLTRNDGLVYTREFSASVNRAILVYPDKKPIIFEKIGRELPDEIRSVIGCYPVVVDKDLTLDLNMAEQLRNNLFLFDENISASTKHKLFNLLTGNDLLDTAFKSLNSDIRSANAEIKHNKTDVGVKQADLTIAQSRLSRNAEQSSEIHFLLDDAVQLQVATENLKGLIDEIQHEQDALLQIQAREIKSIKPESVEALSTTIDRFLKQYSTWTQFQATQAEKAKTAEPVVTLKSDVIDKLNELILTTLKAQVILDQQKVAMLPQAPACLVLDDKEIAGIELEVSSVSAMSELYVRLQREKSELAETVEKGKICQTELSAGIVKEQELLKELKVCPFCGQNVGA